MQSRNFKLYGIEMVLPTSLEGREADVMGWVNRYQINVNLNAKVHF